MTTALGQGTGRDWLDWLRSGRTWLWVHRRRVLEGLVSAALLIAVSLRLARLSGGVLWVPAVWRDVTQLGFVAIGMAMYRGFRLRFSGSAGSGAVKIRPRSAHELSSGDAPEVARTRRHLRGTVLWSLVALVCVSAILVLGNRQLRPWHPDPRKALTALEYSEQAFLDPVTQEVQPSAIEAMLRAQEAPVHLTLEGDYLDGTLLIPFGFPNTQDAREFLDGVAYSHGADGDLVDKAMTWNVGRLIATIRNKETAHMHGTMAVFVGLHLLVVCCMAIILAHTFTWRGLIGGALTDAGGDGGADPDA